MTSNHIIRTVVFLRDALAGLGILYLTHLLGLSSMNVQALTISPEQAHAIQGSMDYDVETVQPKRRAK